MFNYDLAQEFMDIFDSGVFSSFITHTQCKTVGTQIGDLALWAFDSTLIYFICSGGFYSSLISKYWNEILIKTRVSIFRISQESSVLLYEFRTFCLKNFLYLFWWKVIVIEKRVISILQQLKMSSVIEYIVR